MLAVGTFVIAAIVVTFAMQVSSTPQAFEVVSVKRAAADPKGEQCLCEPMGRVAYRSAPLKWIVERAYHLQESQIVGAALLDDPTFDVDGELPEGATAAEIPAMLQAMLLSRFQLAAHSETREIASYALAVGKGGSKLAPPADDWAYSWKANKTGIHLRAKLNLDDLADYLSTQLEKPVVNDTGLQGVFAVSLDFAPMKISASPKVNLAPALPVAIEEQLGLKLEAGKRALPVLVIDSVAKMPTEN
jgi:uncharacterized protein (TIGR03435 family)